jgi:hypothetical protein
MKLKDLDYDQLFYWSGRKWKQMVRLKIDPPRAFTICCAEHPQGGWVDMPSGRNVKPIIRTTYLT